MSQLGDIAETRAAGTTEATAVVVPHTHWDREWYAPLETMRFHLVRFFDELLDVVESDPDLPVVPAGRAGGDPRGLPRGPARPA